MESKSTITRAICLLANPEKGIKGNVKFEENGDITTITATLEGLPTGKHGIHIHEFGNLILGCQTAGAHYNPFTKDHGGPDDEDRHVGDLGNLVADDAGKAFFEIKDKLVRLTGEYSVIGRSIVVHENEDDLGKGNHSDSKVTGHAGGRIVCGVIGVTKDF